MKQKVSLLIPIFLLLFIIVLLFAYFQLQMKYHSLRIKSYAQGVLLEEFVSIQEGHSPDSVALQNIQPLIASDTALQSLMDKLWDHSKRQ